MNICVLGRQPEIGLAELESIYGAKKVNPLGLDCALVEADVNLTRLGGSIKTALKISETNNDQKSIVRQLEVFLRETTPSMPEGKINLGLSFHGFDLTPYTINGIGLHLKKIVKKTGRSARIIPNEAPALSSAQTYHNKLTGERGVEFLVVKDGPKAAIAQVTAVQDIDSYRVRDRERPKRDAFVGMLPPKLAQIIINLATGESTPTCVLDPFCGTGVVLQEALLMGYNVYGTDLSPKMIDYTRANLDWLQKDAPLAAMQLEVADATSYQWNLASISPPKTNLCVATETYLGQPLGGQSPNPEKMREIVHDTNATIRGFLKNISSQMSPGTRLCVAAPAWYVGGKELHLPVIDELETIGFSQQTFQNSTSPLVYRREDQVTGRELLVLEKI